MIEMKRIRVERRRLPLEPRQDLDALHSGYRRVVSVTPGRDYTGKTKDYGLSGQIDYDFGGATLTSITAWREWNWFPANDSDYTRLPVNLQNQQQNFQRQFSQEVRLGSNGSRTIDWVIGGYYFWQVINGYGTSAYGPDAPRWLPSPQWPRWPCRRRRLPTCCPSKASRSQPATWAVARSS